ncbi:MAG: AsmA family protein, partial [Alphaproteobacteria bacterium]|nr:AsmA family protein [Alphaproteobacteria bacterium]
MLLKRLAAGLLAAAMVIAAAAFAAPYLIPSNLIKARLAALVQQRTGRQLLISGPVQIALLPQPRLMADGVALASPWG